MYFGTNGQSQIGRTSRASGGQNWNEWTGLALVPVSLASDQANFGPGLSSTGLVLESLVSNISDSTGFVAPSSFWCLLLTATCLASMQVTRHATCGSTLRPLLSCHELFV